MCLWNPYLQTYDYRYEQVTINGGQVKYQDDGSWRIVVSARDPGCTELGLYGRPSTGCDLVPVVPARVHAGTSTGQCCCAFRPESLK